ncbi:MAG TPA: DNA mismatch repair endonuclease MutL [Thermoplasmata archaeon]|nr:DNA mismatch repair endonuclease MutL [Thermoplasmata archaeon]
MTAAPAGEAEPARIRPLDRETIRRIAAGEVVERPSSVVKELVENAYDAGATEVVVSIQQGGLAELSVRDDGIGIRPEELGAAVERHSTSKLSHASDLERIRTLGFRGEALAAIASVSRLRLFTRPPGAEAAHGLTVVGGKVGRPFVEGAPPGTTVEVRDLFFNTPARRKFLRSAAAEQVELVHTLGSLYLAHPEVGLRLDSEGRELLRWPGTTSLTDAAVRVLGVELLERTIVGEVRPPDGTRIEFVVGHPSVVRAHSAGMRITVNGRPIASRILVQAVRRAFDPYVPKGRFPVGTVRLTLDPQRVDVNVHPTKREVRIAQEAQVAEAVFGAIRTRLADVVSTKGIPSRPTDKLSDEAFGSSGALGPPAASVAGRAAGIGTPLGGRQLALDDLPGARLVSSNGAHPRLLLKAPLFRLYWVAEAEEALVLVDQHAASERVVYEALRADGRLARQALVDPVTIALTPRQAAALTSAPEAIASAGYEVEPFGGGRHRVRSVPSYRGRLARAEALPALLDELADGGRPTVPDGLFDRTRASIACHAAVRGGDEIPVEEMGRILEALYRLPDASYACPHGRPILVRLPRGRLDGWFLRRGT